MGMYLYGQQSNMDCLGKVSWSDEVLEVINKYNYKDFGSSSLFELCIEEVNDMIADLQKIEGTESLIESIKKLTEETINGDYFIFGIF